MKKINIFLLLTLTAVLASCDGFKGDTYDFSNTTPNYIEFDKKAPIKLLYGDTANFILSTRSPFTADVKVTCEFKSETTTTETKIVTIPKSSIQNNAFFIIPTLATDTTIFTISIVKVEAQDGQKISIGRMQGKAEKISVQALKPIEKYIFKINSAPEKAKIELNGVVRSSISIPVTQKNKEVEYKVSHNGYFTKTGKHTVTETKTLDVSLDMIDVDNNCIKDIFPYLKISASFEEIMFVEQDSIAKDSNRKLFREEDDELVFQVDKKEIIKLDISVVKYRRGTSPTIFAYSHKYPDPKANEFTSLYESADFEVDIAWSTVDGVEQQKLKHKTLDIEALIYQNKSKTASVIKIQKKS